MNQWVHDNLKSYKQVQSEDNNIGATQFMVLSLQIVPNIRGLNNGITKGFQVNDNIALHAVWYD